MKLQNAAILKLLDAGRIVHQAVIREKIAILNRFRVKMNEQIKHKNKQLANYICFN